MRINFQTITSDGAPGYAPDIGRTYAARRGGLTYGWSAANEHEARDRDARLSPDQRHDTLNHLLPGADWSLAVPNGTYRVRIVSGDPDHFDGRFGINAEGVIVVAGSPRPDQRWLEGTATVGVSDGVLTVTNAAGSVNNKLSFIEVAAVDPASSAPAAPANVRATSLSASKIRLTWGDAATNEAGFAVDRREGTAWQTIATLAPGATQHTDAGLSAGTEYLYRVRSFNAVGNSSVRASARTARTTGTNIRWETKAPAPIIRAEALTAAFGDELYVFGGFMGDTGPVTRSDVYDHTTDSWRPIADLPTRLTHAGVAVVGRSVYVAGGYVGIGDTGYDQTFGTRDVWRYDVDKNQWFEGPDLPAALASGGLVALGNRLHYFGGNNSSRQDVGVHYVLDLDASSPAWTPAAALPTPRSHMGYVGANGKIYAIAGQSGNDASLTTRAAVHRYDPATDTWTAQQSAPLAVSHISSSTFVLDNRILVFGGETDHEDATNNVMAYDLRTGQWSTLTPLPAERFSGVARELDGMIFFTGGSSQKTTYRGIFAG